MKRITDINDHQHPSTTNKHHLANTTPGKPHKRMGYYDGKIFFASDRATYTFVHEDAVVILHLDVARSSLYLNGHKITSMNEQDELPEFLERFKKCLASNPQTQS